MSCSITFSDSSSITYTYATDGIKLRAVHKIGSATTTTDYCGNVIYEKNSGGKQEKLTLEFSIEFYPHLSLFDINNW